MPLTDSFSDFVFRFNSHLAALLQTGYTPQAWKKAWMMTTGTNEKALLPAGLNDVLPPDATHEAHIVAGLMAVFAARGYDRAEPPLVEFETTLTADGAAGLSDQVFRVMDPVSQRMMGLRADMTLQIARIAGTRLSMAPRPLRLSYAGHVLRVRGTQLRPARQFVQAGVELIGSAAAAADIEAACLAATALTEVGVRGLTLDLTSPAIVGAVLEAQGLADDAAARLRAALDRKDVGAVRGLAKDMHGLDADVLAGLIAAAGPAETALKALAALELPSGARDEIGRLAHVVAGIAEAAPNLTLTVDAVEYRGFEYQTGVSFTLFAQGARGELGRGGRYATGHGEAATGFTLFLDSVMRALPAPMPVPRLFLPLETPPAEAERLRQEGWVALTALEPAADPSADARRLGCSHVLIDGAVKALKKA